MSATLHDYADVEPLVVREMKPVLYPTQREKIVGFIGPSNRDVNCIVCQRKRHAYRNEDGRMEQHFYRKGGGYTFSEVTLDLIRDAGVGRIIIEETDNNRVLEHDLIDFENGVEQNELDDEVQRCVPVEDAVHEWTASEATIIRDHDGK